jgi:8-amino-7-oxononanoate synthase
MRHIINQSLQEILDKRKEQSLYRTLQVHKGLIDFCSNDYLSFTRFGDNQLNVEVLEGSGHLASATGSRSISGNTAFAEELESKLAAFHQAEAGLLFNSGYDANLGLFSCIARKEDTLICDELIHASIIDGCRLSYAGRLRFAHNDIDDLEKKLKHVQRKSTEGSIFVAIESIYSMDGDMAPMPEIAALCKKYQANLIVDEAHATGVFGSQGRGLVNQFGLEQDVFARVHTFGKAIGCHGAVIVGSEVLRNYLINFARSFIFTTALPLSSLVSIKNAYEQLAAPNFSNDYLHELISYFQKDFPNKADSRLILSNSPVQSLVIPGNERARQASKQLQACGFDVRAILSPSIPAGKERLRISLHMHNTFEEVHRLKQAISEILS